MRSSALFQTYCMMLGINLFPAGAERRGCGWFLCRSDARRQAVLDAGAIPVLLHTFTMGIPELVTAKHVARQLPAKQAQQHLRGQIRMIATAEPLASRYLQGYYCGPQHERLASAAAAAALAAISQGSPEVRENFGSCFAPGR